MEINRYSLESKLRNIRIPFRVWQDEIYPCHYIQYRNLVYFIYHILTFNPLLLSKLYSIHLSHKSIRLCFYILPFKMAILLFILLYQRHCDNLHNIIRIVPEPYTIYLSEIEHASILGNWYVMILPLHSFILCNI